MKQNLTYNMSIKWKGILFGGGQVYYMYYKEA